MRISENSATKVDFTTASSMERKRVLPAWLGKFARKRQISQSIFVGQTSIICVSRRPKL
jgi:hypothetical protein